MPRVNKKYIPQELRDIAWRNFGAAIKDAKSESELVLNLHKFLTESEIIMLEKRLLIPILLERKMSYRRIGEAIDVTRTTISFVKKNLRRSTNRRKYSHSGRNQKKRRRVPFLPPRAGHGRWLRVKLDGRDFY